MAKKNAKSNKKLYKFLLIAAALIPLMVGVFILIWWFTRSKSDDIIVPLFTTFTFSIPNESQPIVFTVDNDQMTGKNTMSNGSLFRLVYESNNQGTGRWSVGYQKPNENNYAITVETDTFQSTTKSFKDLSTSDRFVPWGERDYSGDGDPFFKNDPAVTMTVS
jgi:hypothetical protein